MLGGAVHDPCAVLALTHPTLFENRPSHIVVETAGVYSRGMTIIDQRGLVERLPPNCDVLYDVDADAAFGVIVVAVGHFSR